MVWPLQSAIFDSVPPFLSALLANPHFASCESHPIEDIEFFRFGVAAGSTPGALVVLALCSLGRGLSLS